jgi:MFS family permease
MSVQTPDVLVRGPAAMAKRAIGPAGIFAAVLGNSFEFFDFGVYAAYVGIIGRIFYPNDDQFISDLASAATFGIGFVARPLGGILIGAYGDRAGRKPAMTLTIGLMALGSGLIAFLPGYGSIGVLAPILLVLARLIQGFAVGGEMGPATMFMLESAPPARRLFYGSFQIASQNLAQLAVGLAGFLLATTLSPADLNEWGWRLPFVLGIFIAPVGIYIRNQLSESLVLESHASPIKTGAAISAVLKNNWRNVLIGVGLVSGTTVTQYFLINMTPYAIRTLHLPESTAMLGAVSFGIAGAIGALAGGRMADRFGIKPVIVIPRLILTVLILPVMYVLVHNPGATNLAIAIALMVALHAASSTIVLIQQIFPKHIRSTGLAFTYALGITIFGGTATYIVTWLVGISGDPLASAYYVIAANLVTLISVLAVRKVPR